MDGNFALPENLIDTATDALHGLSCMKSNGLTA